jgi:hypothetical protein
MAALMPFHIGWMWLVKGDARDPAFHLNGAPCA